MATVTVGVVSASEEPRAETLVLSESGQPFISLHLGTDISVILPGLGVASAAYARAMATALTAAASECARIASELPATEPEPEAAIQF